MALLHFDLYYVNLLKELQNNKLNIFANWFESIKKESGKLNFPALKISLKVDKVLVSEDDTSTDTILVNNSTFNAVSSEWTCCMIFSFQSLITQLLLSEDAGPTRACQALRSPEWSGGTTAARCCCSVGLWQFSAWS